MLQAVISIDRREREKMALFHVDFFSDVLGMSMQMDVILPQQTSGQIGMEGRAGDGKYKTVYLLHGMSDDQTTWQRRTSIERYVSSLGIAVVMPTTHLGFYTDTTYGMRYWTFISEELPHVCREFFPRMSDRKEDTLAAGLSMGGYGAWKLALGASDTGNHCLKAFSGALQNLREAIMRFCSLLKSLRKKRAGKSFRRCMPGVERRIFCMKEI